MKANKKKEILYLIPETDLTASQVEKVRDFFLDKLKKNKNIEEIVLDVNGIEIVDSLGVNLVIGLYKESNASSKRFKIINAGERFMKVANFFRFTSIFEVIGKEKNK